MRVFEKGRLRRTFRPKKEQVKGKGRHCVTRRFMIFSPHQILFG